MFLGFVVSELYAVEHGLIKFSFKSSQKMVGAPDCSFTFLLEYNSDARAKHKEKHKH